MYVSQYLDCQGELAPEGRTRRVNPFLMSCHKRG
jgi:hypothetical protein